MKGVVLGGTASGVGETVVGDARFAFGGFVEGI